MTVYIDLIFFINFAYDFLLLLTVGCVLKRKISLLRLVLASAIGGLSIFLLFLSWNEIVLFILKLLVSFGMTILSFRYISLRYTLNNVSYLYMCSIVLAGFLYFLNVKFSYTHYGLIFVNKGISVNYLLLLTSSPLILFYYYLCSKKMKSTYNMYYRLEIYFDNIIVNCLAFLDSGNNLKDPISGKAVIIVNKKLLKDIGNIRAPVYVPFNTISGSSIMKCYKPSYIILNNRKIYNYLIGESNYAFNDGVECILNNKLLEDKYV